MPDPITQLAQLQKQSSDILAARIRKLEQLDHGPRIYIGPDDPAALEGVGEGAIWINDSANTISRRDSTDTAWVAISGSGMTNPMTNLGDIIVAIAAGVPTRLPIGSAGEVLTVSGGTASWEPIPTTTHDILSATHDDTTVSAPNDQDILTWDAATSKWIAQAPPASGPHDILSATHTDTTVSAPNDNDVLTWDSGSGTWVAAPIPAQTTMANDPLWDAAGDLAVGTGANTGGKLGIGSAGEVLTVVAGTPSWEPIPTQATQDHAHAGIAGDGNTFDAANLTSGASTDGQVLTSDGLGGAAWESLPAAGAHAILSATHNDTTISAPSDNDVLTWDSGTSKWIAQAPPGGTGADPELAIMNLLGWA